MLEQPIELLQPKRLLSGAGQAVAVAAMITESGFSRPFVIADSFNAERLECLGLDQGTACHPVAPEPDIDGLNTALKAARGLRPDVIIGFGGGSAMDVAKLVAVMLDSTVTFEEISGPARVPARRVTLLQIPTTAGTGSEAGTRALLTEPQTLRKVATESPHMLADLVVLDPDLTVSLPPAVTAATGIDALAHCVEAFTSRRAHPIIDAFALHGIRLIGQNLARAVADGRDRSARAAMLLASYCGGICLGPVNTTAGHAVAYPLGTRHHLPHGLANALIFPHTLAANFASCQDKTAQICQALGISGQDEASLRTEATAWCESLGMNMHLGAHGVPERDLEQMAAEAHAIRRLLDYNPRDLSQSDILALYHAAY